jgi:hypothetical protein
MWTTGRKTWAQSREKKQKYTKLLLSLILYLNKGCYTDIFQQQKE